MQTNKEELNGWQNIGRVLIWLQESYKGKLSTAESLIYLIIVRNTVGYAQYTSDYLSYKKIANQAKVSTRTVERVIPYLIDIGLIIKVATNQIAHTGKLPYKYQLNMKLPEFPSLGKLKSNKETTKQKDPNNYFIANDGVILPLHDYKRKKPNGGWHTSKEWKREVDKGIPGFTLVHPTIEQLEGNKHV